MRQNHYLAQAGYTLNQLIMFERERLAVIALCAMQPQTRASVGKILGIYQATRVIEELREDGFLIRYHHRPTGETRYKLNAEAINARAFFLDSNHRG